MSMVKESLSIEETNKIRISLGLKPLPVDDAAPSEDKPKTDGDGSPPPPDADELAESNYAARRAAEKKEKEARELQERLAKSRNQRELKAKLKGRGLGDLEEGQEDDGSDLKSWIKKQKKRQKQLAADAARKEKELAEQEAGVSYGEKDLEGLKVGHEVEDFEGQDEVILTLKDSRILDAEDDELHNINLTEDAKAREALKIKRKGRQAGQYTGLDDDEFEEPGQRRGVLGKYNDQIDGKQEKSFRLGAASSGPAAAMELDQIGGEIDRAAKKAATAEELKRDLISGDYEKNFERDYLQEGDVGFKKPKTKKKKKDRSTRKSTAVDDSALPATSGDAMEVDGIQAQTAPPPIDDAPVVDDEELQFAMSQMRREAGRMRNKTLKANHALELARRREEAARALSEGGEIKLEDEEEQTLPEPEAEADGEGPDGKITALDETSQFIRNLGVQQQEAAAAAAKKAKQESVAPPPHVKTEEMPDASVKDVPDAPMTEMTENGDVQMRSGSEEVGGDEEAEMARLMAGNTGLAAKAEESDEAAGGTGGESYVAGGMAATLSILKQQGLLKPMTEEERERERLYQQKQFWMAEKRQQDALRQLEREKSKKGGSAKDQAQREYENRQREAVAARETMKAFETYKPVVEIKYHDDFGRELDHKEAWKALSHKFHGKGSGKAKTEKRIKKIEEQKKMEAMASGDTPTGTSEAFRKRQEKLGSATMVLSVGNKGAAPHQEEFLTSLSKSGPSKKDKGKNKASTSRAAKSGTPASAAPDLMMGLGAAAAPHSAAGVSSSLPGSGTATPSMVPRKTAGFKPIAAQGARSSSLAAQVRSESPMTDGGAGTPKISIGLGGVKRKANEEAEGSPSSKRVAQT